MIKHALTIACSLALCASPLSARADEYSSSKPFNDPYALQVTQPGDSRLSCDDMHQESLLMRDIINTTEDLKDSAKLQGHGIKAVGAIGSFLIGSVTGGLGLAAAGFLANNEIESGAEDADNIQDKAEARRSLMVGLYSGKNCMGSIDYVLQDDSNTDNEANRRLSIASLGTLNGLEPAAGSQELSDNLNNDEKPAVRRTPRYND